MSKITLTSLDKRTSKVDKEIAEILSILKGKGEQVSPKFSKAIIDIDSKKNSGDTIIAGFLNYEDENKNTFTILPAIYVKVVDDKIHVSLEEFDGATRIEPQQISTYKNSLDPTVKVRSIVDTAPNFNGMSYNKFELLCKASGGEMLSWKTLFAFQLLILAGPSAKEVLAIRKCEDYKLRDNEDCGFVNSKEPRYIVDRLFEGGFTLFSCEDRDELFTTFADLNEFSIPSVQKFYGRIGNWGGCGESPLFFLGWVDDFEDGWVDYGSARLCKPFNKGC